LIACGVNRGTAALKAAKAAKARKMTRMGYIPQEAMRAFPPPQYEINRSSRCFLLIVLLPLY
jgi:ABC-type Mn2+/Zn2+ transport system ATPase subunit